MPRRLLRLVVALFAIVQAGAPGFASVLDARLAASSLRARAFAHVDRSGERDCPPQHIDDCILCQHLSRPFGHTRAPIALSPVLRRANVVPGEALAAVIAASRGTPHPRGPPAV